MRNRIDPQGVKEISHNEAGRPLGEHRDTGETDPNKVDRLIRVADLKFVDAGPTALEEGQPIPPTRKSFLKEAT